MVFPSFTAPQAPTSPPPASTPATPATPTTPVPAPAPTPAQATPPSTGPGAVPPANNLPPQPAAPAAPISIYDQIMAQNAAPAAEQTPEQLAQQNAAGIMASLMNGAPDPRHDASTVPGINMGALAAQLPSMGLDAGIDYDAVISGLNGEDPTAALKAALGQSQQNTITAIAPLINQMAQSLAQAMATQQTTANQQDMTSASIVRTFNERYAYGTNPSVSPMLTQMANAVAQSAPRNADPNAIADQIHNMLQVMGSSMVQAPAHAQPQAGVSTDFSGMFDNQS